MLAAASAHGEIEFPDQIPDILQPRIHALPAERTVDMGGVTSHEDTSRPQARDLAVMYAKVAAPVEPARFDAARGALHQKPAHEFKGWCVSLHLIDRGHDPPPRRAHREDRERPELTRAELHFVRRERFVGLDIGQEKGVLVRLAREGQVEKMAHLAVRAVAADHIGCRCNSSTSSRSVRSCGTMATNG